MSIFFSSPYDVLWSTQTPSATSVSRFFLNREHILTHNSSRIVYVWASILLCLRQYTNDASSALAPASINNAPRPAVGRLLSIVLLQPSDAIYCFLSLLAVSLLCFPSPSRAPPQLLPQQRRQPWQAAALSRSSSIMPWRRRDHLPFLYLLFFCCTEHAGGRI
jgi:hypothetical protein